MNTKDQLRKQFYHPALYNDNVILCKQTQSYMWICAIMNLVTPSPKNKMIHFWILELVIPVHSKDMTQKVL